MSGVRGMGVDKFGGIGRRYRGPRGWPGKDALELDMGTYFSFADV